MAILTLLTPTLHSMSPQPVKEAIQIHNIAEAIALMIQNFKLYILKDTQFNTTLLP